MPWRPQSFSNLHKRLQSDPEGVSNDLDVSIQTMTKIINANSDSVDTLQPTGGITRNRPVDPTLYSVFFDTTLNKPIWFVGKGKWRDATGALV